MWADCWEDKFLVATHHLKGLRSRAQSSRWDVGRMRLKGLAASKPQILRDDFCAARKDEEARKCRRLEHFDTTLDILLPVLSETSIIIIIITMGSFTQHWRGEKEIRGPRQSNPWPGISNAKRRLGREATEASEGMEPWISAKGAKEAKRGATRQDSPRDPITAKQGVRLSIQSLLCIILIHPT